MTRDERIDAAALAVARREGITVKRARRRVERTIEWLDGIDIDIDETSWRNLARLTELWQMSAAGRAAILVEQLEVLVDRHPLTRVARRLVRWYEGRRR